MKGEEILKNMAWLAAQETYQSEDFDSEVKERLTDLDYVEYKGGEALLIGTSPSEMKAWSLKFETTPKGISLEKFEKESVGFTYQQDMHDLDFPDESFDFVYGSQVLEHSPAPMVVLVQIFRVLKEEGKGFFWIPCDLDNQKQEYHYSCFPKEIWEDLFTKAGFNVNMMTKRFNSWGYGVTKL